MNIALFSLIVALILAVYFVFRIKGCSFAYFLALQVKFLPCAVAEKQHFAALAAVIFIRRGTFDKLN